MRKKTIFATITAMFGLLSGWIFYTNHIVKRTNYEVFFDSLPQSFDGFKVAQISDFHNSEMVNETSSIVKTSKPDIVVITGDFIDYYEMNNAIKLIDDIINICPIYFVSGNHEAASKFYKELYTELEKRSINILRNKNMKLYKKDDCINILGIDDPNFIKKTYTFSSNRILTSLMIEKNKEEGFTILLDHRPELFDEYVNNGIDIAFTGHAHGGQFRIPFIGGLYSPGQGILPEYDCGVYEKNETMMIVSRGIGKSKFPFRLNNIPEVVIATLKKS